jgi:hypothetical protein
VVAQVEGVSHGTILPRPRARAALATIAG